MKREDMVALVQRQAAAWERSDPDSISADFAPDGALVSPSGRWVGPAEVRQAARAFFNHSTDIQITVSRILVDGEQGAIEWVWSETDMSTGQRKTAHDAIIFTIHGDKISYWREYID